MSAKRCRVDDSFDTFDSLGSLGSFCAATARAWTLNLCARSSADVVASSYTGRIALPYPSSSALGVSLVTLSATHLIMMAVFLICLIHSCSWLTSFISRIHSLPAFVRSSLPK